MHLNEIGIEITSECNLNCKFCKKKNQPISKIPKQTIFQILDQIKSLNIKAVRFTGGEPLIRKDLNEILTYAKRLNLC
jgi:molybdenum cofactor biosynthesis enzyme MoaA